MKYFTYLLVLILAVSETFSDDAESLKIIVNNPAVRIINANVNANCCSKYAFEIIQPENTEGTSLIKVIETDTSTVKCYCMCKFDLETEMKFLNPGHYIIEVYRIELKKYLYPEDKTIFVGRDSFDIINPFSPPFSISFKQWDCDVKATGIEDNQVLPQTVVYPNPAATGIITIGIMTPENSMFTLVLTDIFGRNLYTREYIDLNKGMNLITFSTDGFAPGTYLCKVFNEESIYRITKITIVK